MALKRTKRSITTPTEAEAIIRKRCADLRLTFQQYVTSLITYDCWAEKPHLLTGAACRGSRADELRLWEEIKRDFGKPGKTGSFFEHRLDGDPPPGISTENHK